MCCALVGVIPFGGKDKNADAVKHKWWYDSLQRFLISQFIGDYFGKKERR
jgi:hypothetical protein